MKEDFMAFRPFLFLYSIIISVLFSTSSYPSFLYKLCGGEQDQNEINLSQKPIIPPHLTEESYNEEAYIFDVGQGNCQFFKYGDLGILYDGGSSVSRTFSKIDLLKRKVFKTILTEKQIVDVDMKEEDMDSFLSSGKFSKLKIDKNKFVSNVSESNIKDDKTRIIKILKEAKLNYLILFLSHPDEDHINYIKDILSDKRFDNLPMLSFLGGDWFNHDTEDSMLLTDFLSMRAKKVRNSLNFYPYYFNFQPISENEPANYNDLVERYEHLAPHFLKEWKKHDTHVQMIKKTKPYKNKIQEIKNQIKEIDLQETEKKILIKKEIKKFHTEQNIEEHSDFIEKLKKINKFPDLKHGNYAHRNPLYGTLKELIQNNSIPAYQDFPWLETLRNIYIWSLNGHASDVNTQSIVISCTMPKLEKNFFCTGDANDFTFYDIARSHQNKFIKNNFLNVIIIPHHGSDHNRSMTMIDLFSPHILISSAGYGGNFNHPESEVYDFYKQKMKSNQETLQFIKDQLPINPGEDEMISFDSDGNAKLWRYENDGFIFLSTNLCGDIRFDKSGISRKYDPILTLNGVQYRPDISQSVFSTEKGNLNQPGISLVYEENKPFPPHKYLVRYREPNVFQHSEAPLYYQVKDEKTKKIWLYKVNPISSFYS